MPDAVTARARASVKDVAAAAGVSLGTVSNVLNRPDRVSPDDPGAGRAGDGRARLRAQRVGPAAPAPARSRTLGLRHARRRQPVLHRRRPGHREPSPRPPTCRCSCATATTGASREAAHLATCEQQRVQGILVTPVDPDSPGSTSSRARGTPVVIVDRTRAGRRRSARSRSTTSSAAGSPSSTSSTAATAGSRSSAGRQLGQVRDRLEGARQAWRRRRPARPTT